MNTNKRKSNNNNNNNHVKKIKSNKNEPKLVKRISQQFVRRKDCLQHYNESNSFYAPERSNIESNTGKKAGKRNISNINSKEILYSISSFFGNSSLIPHMSFLTNKDSPMLCQPINNDNESIGDKTNDSFPTYQENDINDQISNNEVSENSNPSNNTTSNINDLSSISELIYSNHKVNQFDPTSLMSIKLFKILSKANSPLYLYDEISEFIKNCYLIMRETNKQNQIEVQPNFHSIFHYFKWITTKKTKEIKKVNLYV